MQIEDKESNQVKIVCFICGRKQIKQILAKHLRGCENRYKRQEEKKIKQPQKPCPLPPSQLHQVLKNQNCSPEKIEIYNQKALAKYKNESQPTCKKCWKQFNSEIFPTHQVGCQVKPKAPSQISTQGPALRRATSYDFDFRKPKVLMCAICGREFGLTSLKIHHPQCVQKFNNQQSKKPKQQRRELPLMEEHFMRMMNDKEDWDLDEIEEFNNQANRIYRDKGLVKCFNCGRAFFIQSIEKHRKNCKLIFGEINMYEEPQPVPKDDTMVKPRVVMCHICGREFGTKSLLIHQKQCIQKFLNQERKKLKVSDQRPVPELPQEITSKFDLATLPNWKNQELEEYNNMVFDFYNKRTLQPCPNCNRTFLPASLLKHLKGCHGKSQPHRSYSAPAIEQHQEPRKPKTLVCYICGREFGLTSLSIHQPQCQLKYRNEQSKKDIDDRKDLPQIDPKYIAMLEQSNWTNEKLEQFNNYMFQVYKSTVLQKCYTCGRTFFHESLLKHKKLCVKKENTSSSPLKSSSKASSQKLLRKPNVKITVEKEVVLQQENQDEEENNKPATRKTEIDFNRLLKPTIASSTKIERKTVHAAPATPKTQKIQKPKIKVEDKLEVEGTLKKKMIRKDPLPKFTKPATSKKIEMKVGVKYERNMQSRISIQLEETEKEQIIQEVKIIPWQNRQPNIEGQTKGNSRIKTQPTLSQTVQDKIIELSLQQIKLDYPTKTQVSQSEAYICQFCNKKLQKSQLQKHTPFCSKNTREIPRKSIHSFRLQNQSQIERCMKCHKKIVKSQIDRHIASCKGAKADQINSRRKGISSVMTTNGRSEPKEKNLKQTKKNLPINDEIYGEKVMQSRKQKQSQMSNIQPAITQEQLTLYSIGIFSTNVQQSNFEECNKCNRKFQKEGIIEHKTLCIGATNQTKNSKSSISPKNQLNKSFTKNSSKNSLNTSYVSQSIPTDSVQISSQTIKNTDPFTDQHNSTIKTNSQSMNLLKNMTNKRNQKQNLQVHHSQFNKSSQDLKKTHETNKTSKPLPKDRGLDKVTVKKPQMDNTQKVVH